MKDKSQAGFDQARILSLVVEPPAFAGAGIESVSGQAPYSLPRDHAMHGGKFYQTDDFSERQAFTILGKDLDTGEDISIVWMPFSQGWMKDEGRPLLNGSFSYHNIRTGEFHTASVVFPGTFTSEGTPPDAKKFRFRYAMTGPETAFTTEYAHATETWRFTVKSAVADVKKTPFSLDFTAVLAFPGYLPAAYWGLDAIGHDPQDRQTPETMCGLTWHYIAPNMATSGSVSVAGKTIRFVGTGWFEHRWGNVRNACQQRHFSGYARMTNGDIFGWQQYFAGEGFSKPRFEMNRFMYLDGITGRRENFFGPSFWAETTQWWTSPTTGQRYPWWGLMKTPKGTFYYGPSYPDQEVIGMDGGFIAGVIKFRRGSPGGPVVATGFCEMVDHSTPMETGSDPSTGPAISQGLPEKPDLGSKAEHPP